MKKHYMMFSICLMFFAAVQAISAFAQTSADKQSAAKQEAAEEENYTEADRPSDSYLAKFHANDIVDKLMKKNLDQLIMMRVISSNFDNGWSGDVDKCFEGYKKAMSYYYKRNMVYAGKEFESNKTDIDAVLKKMAEYYQTETKSMLDECIPLLLDAHMSAKTAPSADKNRQLGANQARLRVAYGRYDDGSLAIMSKQYETAVHHFRAAKSYAIVIFEDFASPEEQESVKTKYQVHKADNLNRKFNNKSASKSQAK